MRSASHSHAAAAAASSSDDSFAATHAGSASASSAPSRSVPNYATLDAKIQAMQTRGTAAAAAGAAGAAEWSAPAAAASSSSSSLLRRSHSSTVHDHAAAASAASSSHSRGAGGPPLLLRSASTRAPGQVAIRDCSITSNGHASGIHMPRTSDDDVLLRIEIQYVPAHLLESQGSGAAAAPSSSMELVESMQPFSSPPCSLPHLQFPAHSSAAFVSDDPSSIGSSPAALALKREMSPSTLSNNTHSHSKKQRTNTDQTPAASCGGAASAASISASSSGASSLINSTDSIANAASSSTQSQSRKPRGALDDDDDDDEMTTMRDAPAPPTAEALVQAESFRVQCEADAHNPRVRLLWISRKTLISSSVYFAKMLEASSGWQEGRSRVINLPAADLAEAELLSGLFWSLVSPGRRFPSWFGWNRRLALLAICTYYCMEDRLAHLCDCIAHDLLKPETRVARCCEFMFRLPCATDHPRIQLLQALARKRFLEFFCEIQPAVETHTHAQREAERLTADEGSDDSSDHERASGGGHPHLLDRQRRSASRESRAALQQSHSPSAEALRPFPPPSTLTALSHFHNRWWKSSDAFAKLELPALRFLFQGMHLERDLSAVQEAAANGSLSIQPPLVLRPNPFVSSSLDCMNTMYLSLRFWVMRHHPYFVWKERRKIERIKQREEEQREKQRRELSRSASSVAAPASSSSSSAYAAAGSTPRFISPAEVEADRSLIASWLQMEPQLLSLISCIRWRSLDLDFLLNHCVALPAERESSASDGAPAKATAQAGTSCFFWHVPCVAANPRAFMSAELEREQIAAEEALAAVDASQSDALEFPDAPPVAVYAPPATACRGTCAHCVKRQAYVASAVTQALAANLTGGRRAVDLKAASTTTNNNNSANDAATAAALAASNGGGGAGLTYPTSSAPSSSLLALMKQKRRSVLGIGGVMATMGGMAHGLGGSEGSSTAAAAAAAGSAHHPRALPPSTSSHSSVDDPDQEPGTCECNTCREFVPLLMHVCTACGFSCCKACLAKLLEITSHIDSQRCPVCNAKANFYAAVQIMAPTRPRGTGASQTAAASASTGSNGSAARLELARLWSLGGLRSGGGFGDPRRLAGLLHPLDDPIEYLYSRMGAGLGGVGGAGGASDEEEEEMMLRHSLMAARHHEGEREAAIVRMLEQEHALMRAHQRATMAIQRAEGGTRATTTFSNASSRLGTRARHILRPGVDEDAELQRALLASLESLSAAGGSASPDSPWMRSATAAAEAALMRDQAEPDFLDLDQYLSTGAAAASASVPPAASTAAAASSSSHKSSAHIPVLRRLDSSSGSHSSSNGSRSSSSASRASVPSLVALPDHPLPLRSKHAPRPNSHSAAASSSSSAGAAAGATSGHPSELGVDGEDDTLMIILRPHNNPEAADIRFMCRRTAPLSRLMVFYARKSGADVETLRFVWDGQRIRPDQTPAELDMESEDVIDVHVANGQGHAATNGTEAAAAATHEAPSAAAAAAAAATTANNASSSAARTEVRSSESRLHLKLVMADFDSLLLEEEGVLWISGDREFVRGVALQLVMRIKMKDMTEEESRVVIKTLVASAADATSKRNGTGEAAAASSAAADRFKLPDSVREHIMLKAVLQVGLVLNVQLSGLCQHGLYPQMRLLRPLHEAPLASPAPLSMEDELSPSPQEMMMADEHQHQHQHTGSNGSSAAAASASASGSATAASFSPSALSLLDNACAASCALDPTLSSVPCQWCVSVHHTTEFRFLTPEDEAPLRMPSELHPERKKESMATAAAAAGGSRGVNAGGSGSRRQAAVGSSSNGSSASSQAALSSQSSTTLGSALVHQVAGFDWNSCGSSASHRSVFTGAGSPVVWLDVPALDTHHGAGRLTNPLTLLAYLRKHDALMIRLKVQIEGQRQIGNKGN